MKIAIIGAGAMGSLIGGLFAKAGNERWNAIIGLLGKLAPNTKGSMLQDVENKRQTEIDVINGAIVEAGRPLGIPTPYNNVMVCLIKALEATFIAKR